MNKSEFKVGKVVRVNMPYTYGTIESVFDGPPEFDESEEVLPHYVSRGGITVRYMVPVRGCNGEIESSNYYF